MGAAILSAPLQLQAGQNPVLDPSFASLQSYGFTTVRGNHAVIAIVPNPKHENISEANGLALQDRVTQIFSRVVQIYPIPANDSYLIHNIDIIKRNDIFTGSLVFGRKNGSEVSKVQVNISERNTAVSSLERGSYVTNEQLQELQNCLKELFNILQEIYANDSLKENAQTQKEADILNKFLPISDRLGVWRNGIGLCGAILTFISLLTPIGLLGLAIGFSILVVLVGVLHIHAYYKISKAYPENEKEIYKLIVMSLLISLATIVSSCAIGTGINALSDTIITIFGLLVAIQAVCFIKQGLGGWYTQGARWEAIAKSGNDPVLATTANLKKFSGAMSGVEGSLWLILGLVRMTLGISLLFCGQAGTPLADNLNLIINILTAALFDVIFTVSYTLMIVGGCRDKARHTKFLEELKEAENSSHNRAERLLHQLRFLKYGRDYEDNRERTLEEIIRNKNAVAECTGYNGDCAKNLENLDFFILILEEAINNRNQEQAADAERIVEFFIQDVVSAVERNIKIDKWGIIIGCLALIFGQLINHGIPLISGDFGEPGIPGFSMHFSSLSSDSDFWGAISGMSDYSFWMLINHWFETKQDDTPGRTEEEESRLKYVNEFLTEYKRRMQAFIASAAQGRIQEAIRERKREEAMEGINTGIEAALQAAVG